ncbi:MAG: helix-turn-helix transcriptional regulator [Myxococcales bacterium]|nr:MAG: helix-turn-helix transcriptional regulator [Myxococcales bacterium]
MKKRMNSGTFAAVAQRFRILGVPLRLQILQQLSDGEQSVSELVQATGSSQPNVSKHLATLLSHGFVKRAQRGNTAFYTVTDKTIFELCDLVCGTIENSLARQKEMLEG